jgi:alginate O-acetyltransferase complex protein AlgI
MWSLLVLASGAWLAFFWLLVFAIPNKLARHSLAYLLPFAVVVSCFAVANFLNPFAKLALSGLVLLGTFKGSALLLLPRERVFAMNRYGLAYFSLVWPGIDPVPFVETPVGKILDGKRFGAGIARAIVGVLGFLLVAGYSQRLGDLAAGWLGIACLLTIFHLGLSDCLTEVTQAIGWSVKPLFESPLRSTSLSDFWSRRWNRPFVELNRVFFMPALVRRLGIKGAIFVIFLISGFLHELAISYPAGAGWGMPLGYFAFQGVMVLAERKLAVRGPIWVALVVMVPLPFLFHATFRSFIILPFVAWTRTMMLGIGLPHALSILVFMLGVAQFCILAASFQVPTRLRWKEELPRLSSLNHKLMWTYGSFVVYTILSFGVLTLVLHDDISHGSRAGLAISTVMFLWWGLRLGTDIFYFSSDDWPKGQFMQIGHVMLNCLFIFIFCGYGCLLSCHLLGLLP